MVLDLKGIASFADCFIICGGNQNRQTQAIANAIVERCRAEGERPWHIEGYERGDWILLDFSDLVVHVFTPETRAFYALERLWGDAPRRSVKPRSSQRGKRVSAQRKS